MKKDLYSAGSIGEVYLEVTFQEIEGAITTNNNKTVKYVESRTAELNPTSLDEPLKAIG